MSKQVLVPFVDDDDEWAAPKAPSLAKEVEDDTVMPLAMAGAAAPSLAKEVEDDTAMPLAMAAAIQMQEATSRASGAGGSSDLMDDNDSDFDDEEHEQEALVVASENESVDEDVHPSTTIRCSAPKQNNIPHMADTEQWAGDRHYNGAEQANFFKNGLPNMRFGTADTANRAVFILTAMVCFVNAKYKKPHPDDESKYFFHGHYSYLGSTTLWVCLCLSIAWFEDGSFDGWQVGSKNAAKRWQLAQLFRLMRLYAKSQRFTSNEGRDGEDNDQAMTRVSTGRASGITNDGLRQHEKSEHKHRRSIRVDSMCKNRKLKRQLKTFRFVYDKVRETMGPDYQSLPSSDKLGAIFNQEPPAVQHFPGRVAQDDEEEDEFEARLVEMERIQDEKRKKHNARKKMEMGISGNDTAKEKRVVIVKPKEKKAARAVRLEKKQVKEKEGAERLLKAQEAWNTDLRLVGQDAAGKMIPLRGDAGEDNLEKARDTMRVKAVELRKQRELLASTSKSIVDAATHNILEKARCAQVNVKADAKFAEEDKAWDEWETVCEQVNGCYIVGERDDEAYYSLSYTVRNRFDAGRPKPKTESYKRSLEYKRPVLKTGGTPAFVKEQERRANGKYTEPVVRKRPIDEVVLKPGELVDYAIAFGLKTPEDALSLFERMESKCVSTDGRSKVGIWDSSLDEEFEPWMRIFYDFCQPGYDSRIRGQRPMYADLVKYEQAYTDEKKRRQPKRPEDQTIKGTIDRKTGAFVSNAAMLENEERRLERKDIRLEKVKKKRSLEKAKLLKEELKVLERKDKAQELVKKRNEKVAKSVATQNRLNDSRKRRGVEHVTQKVTIDGVVRTASSIRPTAETLERKRQKKEDAAVSKVFAKYELDFVKKCMLGPPKSGNAVNVPKPILEDNGTFRYEDEEVWEKDAYTMRNWDMKTKKPLNLVAQRATTGAQAPPPVLGAVTFRLTGYATKVTGYKATENAGRADTEEAVWEDRLKEVRVIGKKTGTVIRYDHISEPTEVNWIVHPAGTQEAKDARERQGMEPEEELSDQDNDDEDDDESFSGDLFGDDDDDDVEMAEAAATTTDVPSSAFSSMAGPSEDFVE